jgi:hypothetical protein
MRPNPRWALQELRAETGGDHARGRRHQECIKAHRAGAPVWGGSAAAADGGRSLLADTAVVPYSPGAAEAYSARRFAAAHAHHMRVMGEVAEALGDGFRPARVLDFGCGSGRGPTPMPPRLRVLQCRGSTEDLSCAARGWAAAGPGERGRERVRARSVQPGARARGGDADLAGQRARLRRGRPLERDAGGLPGRGPCCHAATVLLPCCHRSAAVPPQLCGQTGHRGRTKPSGKGGAGGVEPKGAGHGKRARSAGSQRSCGVDHTAGVIRSAAGSSRPRRGRPKARGPRPRRWSGRQACTSASRCRRGAWARVTTDQFRRLSLQTFKNHGAASNIFSDNMSAGAVARVRPGHRGLRPLRAAVGRGAGPEAREPVGHAAAGGRARGPGEIDAVSAQKLG